MSLGESRVQPNLTVTDTGQLGCQSKREHTQSPRSFSDGAGICFCDMCYSSRKTRRNSCSQALSSVLLFPLLSEIIHLSFRSYLSHRFCALQICKDQPEFPNGYTGRSEVRDWLHIPMPVPVVFRYF